MSLVFYRSKIAVDRLVVVLLVLVFLLLLVVVGGGTQAKALSTSRDSKKKKAHETEIQKIQMGSGRLTPEG